MARLSLSIEKVNIPKLGYVGKFEVHKNVEIGKCTSICPIRQYFTPQKFSHVQYFVSLILWSTCIKSTV